MNRSRRIAGAKPFVSGGVYDANVQVKQRIVQPSANNIQVQPQWNAEQQMQHVRQPQVEEQQQWHQPAAQVVEVMTTDQSDVANKRVHFKSIFQSRKKSSVRIKEKKIRQNRQLRKAISPKNALMALNEVKGITISEFNVTTNADVGAWSAVVTVNERQYEGRGNTKNAAKNNACEKALRDYVLEKMRKHPRFKKNTGNECGEASMDTGENNGDSDLGEEAEDIPMINLASFAIYKLFLEWENEGYEIPELHPPANQGTHNGSENGASVPKEPKPPMVRNELPPNWDAIHPATLLCMMRPGLSYTDHGLVGEKPNVLQKIGVVVDDNKFISYGRSKKVARRNVAVDVCNTLFGTNFVKEAPYEAMA